MELRERGWSILAAARGAGVSRTTDNDWSRGYKTYRHGKAAGFVPPLDRLAVRDISDRFLSQDERIEIADLLHAGLSMRQIADRLGRAASTISRELRRNAASDGHYRPFEAQHRATARRARHRPRRIETSPDLRQAVPGGHENYFDELMALLQRTSGRPEPDEVAGLRTRYDIEQITPPH